MSDPHSDRALYLLRGDVETWRTMALRWIRACVDTQLRLSAAERVLAAQIERIAEQQRTIERQREQLQEQRDCWARMSRESLRNT